MASPCSTHREPSTPIIKVLLVNFSNDDFVVNDGERIAQMVVARYEQVQFETVSVLDETERGEGGYGHTGVK